jgi:hypothetical protein
MPDQTPILSFPLILPAQAQKHVTHNEALRLLDVMVQLVVKDRGLTAPPASPVDGDRHIIADGAIDAWAGKEGQIAAFWDNAWLYLMPQEGWAAFVTDEAMEATYIAGEWLTDNQRDASFAQVGVNATADAINRLSVNADATLFNHDGAGHQVKLNKATSGDTASLLYQSGFSGRAEIGLAGSEDLSIKVSPDGSLFQEALIINSATAEVTLPGQVTVGGLGFDADPDTGLASAAIGQLGFRVSGVIQATLDATALQLDVPLNGLAVTQGQVDPTPGRLMSVGAFGLGSTDTPDFNSDDAGLPTLFGRMTAGTRVDGSNWHALHLSRATDQESAQIAVRDAAASAGSQLAIRHRDGTGAWSAWNPLYGQKNILGAVSLSVGQVTGALIERGSNANGDYVRFADGTQICWHTLSVPNVTSALGSLFQSAAVTWTFPATFDVAATVSGAANSTQCWLGIGASGVFNIQFRVLSPTSLATAVTCRLMAIGRWA